MVKKAAKYAIGGFIVVAALLGILILLMRQFAPGLVVTVPYYALKIGDTLDLRARVLHSYQFATPTQKESIWFKLMRNFMRMESRELKNYPSRLEVGTSSLSIKTDEDGFVHYRGFWDKSLPQTFQWRLVVDDPKAINPFSNGRSIHPNSFVVVSDLDDTLIISNVSDKVGLGKRILAKEAWDLKVVPGAADFLQGLSKKGATIIYLSASPWNFHDQLSQFLKMNGFPEGALILRNFGVGDDADPLLSSGNFKKQVLPDFIQQLHGGKLLLLGDSGEQDPEVYVEMEKLVPSEKIFIAIRNAGGPKRVWSRDIVLFSAYEELQKTLSEKLERKGMIIP